MQFLKAWLRNVIICLPIMVVIRCAFHWRQLADHTLDIPHKVLLWSLLVSAVIALITTISARKSAKS